MGEGGALESETTGPTLNIKLVADQGPSYSLRGQFLVLVLGQKGLLKKREEIFQLQRNVFPPLPFWNDLQSSHSCFCCCFFLQLPARGLLSALQLSQGDILILSSVCCSWGLPLGSGPSQASFPSQSCSGIPGFKTMPQHRHLLLPPPFLLLFLYVVFLPQNISSLKAGTVSYCLCLYSHNSAWHTGST